MFVLASVALVQSSGCNISRVGATQPTQNPTLVSSGQGETVAKQPKVAVGRSSVSAGAKKLTRDTSGKIIAKRVWAYSVKPGSSKPLDISGAVEAVDKRSGQVIHRYGYSAASFGKLVALPLSDAKTLYYPPGRSCLDQIEIQAIATDGLYAEFKVTIRVTNKGGQPKKVVSANRFKERVTPELVITNPKDGATSNFVLIIRGTAIGQDGESLRLVIKNRFGVEYVQNGYFDVWNGHFEARGYLGDPEGHGVGEEFKIWVRDGHGNVSNVVTVRRR